jgi:hypothetical protein
MARKKTPTRTFTIPTADSDLIVKIQSRCRKLDLELNDSEVVRASLAALVELPDGKFKAAVKSVERLRRGKPPQEG